jgi:hypothetical protein
MSKQTPDERRESFRIEMLAYVKATEIDGHIKDPQDYFRDLQSIALVSEMKALDQEYFLISERIKDLAGKKSIELLHQQINILSKLAISQTLSEQSLVAKPINISEGGCQVTLEKTFKTDETIALALVFQPSYFSLITFAKVVSVDDNSHSTHLQFIDMSERQQQLLVKHMFQAQTESKKKAHSIK